LTTLGSARLPLGHPPVIGYLCNAYPLAIAAQEDKYLDWFYSNFIQLMMIKGFPSEEPFFTFHAPVLQWHQYVLRCPFITYQKLEVAIVDGYKSGVLDFICDSIDRGRHVHVYADEYYISHNRAYQTFHFPHEMLVSGYDKEKRTLTVMGFDQRMVFGIFEIDFDEFIEAYRGCSRDTIWNDHIPFAQYVYLLEYNPHFAYKFDKELVIQSLKEYRASANSSAHYRAQRNPDEDSYGMAFYGLMELYLRQRVGEEGGWIDLRFSHAFWEHKKVMLDRIDYMDRKGYHQSSPEVREACRIIEQTALVARNACIKYNARHQVKAQPDELQRILGLYSDMAALERDFLARFIAELEGGN